MKSGEEDELNERLLEPPGIEQGYKYHRTFVPDFFGNQDSQGVGNGITIFIIYELGTQCLHVPSIPLYCYRLISILIPVYESIYRKL